MAKSTEQTGANDLVLAMKFRDLRSPEDFCQQYIVAGAVFSLSTNSEEIHAAVGESFAVVTEPVPAPEVTMRLLVEAGSHNAPAWPKPYFRGLRHLVFARFDSESQLLVDLRTHRIIGRFSPALAADRAYLKKVVFPAIFGIVSQTIRITPLHCACVAWNARGFLLAGESGSGKSTLSLALAQSGLTFISDDWTFLSRRGSHVLAWSLNNSLKLLPDAAEHFPELAQIDPIVSLNDELAYELEPDRLFGIRHAPSTEPRCVIFLKRQENQEFNLTKMSSSEAVAHLEQSLEELPATVWSARDFLMETFRILAQLPCWELRYGADAPQVTARSLLRFLNDNVDPNPASMREEYAS
ncbi:MAG: HPr kinase/phosphorylase [Terriglobia bacterium]